MKFPLSLHPSVLLVDDNRDGLLVRRALLEEQGYRVAMAANGEEGLKLYEADHFDVVVTDYRMPIMGGVELIRRIRATKPHARFVLLSGFVEPLGLNEENTGADAVIAKNSNEAAHLVRWVKRLINRAPSRKPAASQSRSLARARA
jgi:sigma-B regulation protein RsbU (phosphoserine phosphatase)